MTKSFRNYNYDFTRDMMTVYFSSIGDPEGAAYASAAHNIHCKKGLKMGTVWLCSIGGIDAFL